METLPTATWSVCLNIAYTLLSVPAFYQRVCRLMRDLQLPPPFEQDPESEVFFPWSCSRRPQHSAKTAYEFVTRRVEELVEVENLGEEAEAIVRDLLTYFRNRADRERRENRARVTVEEEERLLVQVAGMTTPKSASKEEITVENNKTRSKLQPVKRPCTVATTFWTEDSVELPMVTSPVQADTSYEDYPLPQDPQEAPYPSLSELLSLKATGRLDIRYCRSTAAEVQRRSAVHKSFPLQPASASDRKHN